MSAGDAYIECQHYRNCGGFCETPDEIDHNMCESCLMDSRAEERAEALVMNATIRPSSCGTVAVDTAYHWIPISSCPRGVKVQLLGKGGMAQYSIYQGDSFWTDWAPLPTNRKDQS